MYPKKNCRSFLLFSFFNNQAVSMSDVIYLIGAGASFGERGRNQRTGNIEPGMIVRGLPIVNQLGPAIDWYCGTVKTGIGFSESFSDYKSILRDLRWLEEKCQTYPTIDTYAKKLAVTGNHVDLTRLKNALTSFFALIQDHKKRDLRYDGFIASIIQDDGSLPNNVSILSWNYDYQLEFVLQDFSSKKGGFQYVWENQGITCKGLGSHFDISRFNCVKLNGTAMFSRNSVLIDPANYSLAQIEDWCKNDFDTVKSNISFAWEKDDHFIDSILPLVKNAKVLVVIGYSFPYVNRTIDRKIIQNMESLREVFIQDSSANDVKQSFETLLSDNQRRGYSQRLIQIHPRPSVSQFIIPNIL